MGFLLFVENSLCRIKDDFSICPHIVHLEGLSNVVAHLLSPYRLQDSLINFRQIGMLHIPNAIFYSN